MPKALIFGASSQAGWYLAQFLCAKGYDVDGALRYSASGDLPLFPGVNYYKVESLELRGAERDIRFVIREHRYDEIYNLASTMYAPASWSAVSETMLVNAWAVGVMLDECTRCAHSPKFFQAGSAEVFDKDYPQFLRTEEARRGPRNPYGVSKLAAEELVRVYREWKGLFAVAGILFNMESMRRSKTFFAQKVILEALRIRGEVDAGKVPVPMQMGQLTAVRDWGLTREYVEAMWKMLQASTPRDYVIATGVSANCYGFVKETFKAVGLVDAEETNEAQILQDWLRIGKQVNETDSVVMRAEPSAIRRDLGWEAQTKFPAVVKVLVAEARQMQEAGVVV